MKQPSRGTSWVAVATAGVCLAGTLLAEGPAFDFGLYVQRQLRAHSDQLFGIVAPLDESALGPYAGANSALAILLAKPLKATVVSTAVNASADQIALWPDDDNPAYLYVCDESTSNPAVERVDLSKPANANVTTILTGLSSCDPVRRTPWGSIVVAEEAGLTGGFYEILDPASIGAPIAVTDRATGTTSDARVVKRQAVGSLSWEGIVILPDGTMYFGDELRPGGGVPGGGIYKFVPTFPYNGAGQITNPAASPFADGQVFGLRVGSASDYGQGTEIGQGLWVDVPSATYADANGNVLLRNAQAALKFAGYYRPEDMDQDPMAAANGEVRACWTNTGRMSNGGDSVIETASTYGEVMCLVDAPDAQATTGATPTVTRFLAGDKDANYFDNLDFQPHTGNLVVLEDGEVVVAKKGGGTQLRGNDIWMCLPDGTDRDVQSDGCIRIISLKDTDSEPTGFIFTGSGDTAFVNLQHRSTGTGALLKNHGLPRAVGQRARDRPPGGLRPPGGAHRRRALGVGPRRQAIGRCRLGDFVVQNRRRDDAAVEVAEVELLVGGVRVFVGQADAEEHGRRAELLLERRDDRNRSAFPAEHRRLAEALLDGAAGRLDERIVVLGQPRLAAVHAGDRQLDRLRRDLPARTPRTNRQSFRDSGPERGACSPWPSPRPESPSSLRRP